MPKRVTLRDMNAVLLFSADPSDHPFPPPAPPSSTPSSSSTSSSTEQTKSAPPKLAFHLFPTSQAHMDQNFAIWKAVQNSTVHPSTIPALSADPQLEVKPLHIPIFMMPVPIPLFQWLANLNWGEVLHAMVCLIHHAAVVGYSLQDVYKSVRRELWSITSDQRYWQGIDREDDGEPEFGFTPGDPNDEDRFRTRHMAQLAFIARSLSSRRLSSAFPCAPTIRVQSRWTLIPTTVSIDAHVRRAFEEEEGDDKMNRVDAVVHALWALWLMFANVAMRKRDVRRSIFAERFSRLIGQNEFNILWRQIEELHQLGGVKKRCRCPLGVDENGGVVMNKDDGLTDGCRWQEKGLELEGDKEQAVKRGFQSFADIEALKPWKGRICKKRKATEAPNDTLFALLPEEIITDHIIPALCVGPLDKADRMRQENFDMYSE